MARKGCHVLGILADLATVLLLFRCNTATCGMRALSRSCHTSTSLPSYRRFCKEQGSTLFCDAEGWGFGFLETHIFPGFGSVDGWCEIGREVNG
jgi:hypothetical protein